MDVLKFSLSLSLSKTLPMALHSLSQVISYLAKGLAEAKGLHCLLALLHIRSDQKQFVFALLRSHAAISCWDAARRATLSSFHARQPSPRASAIIQHLAQGLRSLLAIIFHLAKILFSSSRQVHKRI